MGITKQEVFQIKRKFSQFNTINSKYQFATDIFYLGLMLSELIKLIKRFLIIINILFLTMFFWYSDVYLY